MRKPTIATPDPWPLIDALHAIRDEVKASRNDPPRCTVDRIGNIHDIATRALGRVRVPING